MVDKRILIVAGTHVRENDFSYSVADKLIARYGQKDPDQIFQGIDCARQGRLWLYDGLAVAKIDKVGETSLGYLQTLSREDLIKLSIFKSQHVGCKFPPSICGIFENIAQWTSVSGDLIRVSNANMYVDLHSFHAYSNLNKTGLCVVPHSRENNFNLMKSSLDLAKKDDPEIYGVFESNFNPSEENQREIKKRYFDDSGDLYSDVANLLIGYKKSCKNIGFSLRMLDGFQLIDFLIGKEIQGFSEIVSNSKQVSSQLFGYECESIIRLANMWGNMWYLNDQNKSHPKLDSFTFEAVHWQDKQQNAVVNFTEKYLLPNFNKYQE
ncbi:hypothetical protein HN385_04825 [archaeon]|nr:hypothetical protein [archaeon]MBT3451038.1 hypothetical protein [archaeon]MBT6869128.1 hypothetical protein [archaeon]MBT7192775.1 hypothetical protein [archaeon]MBT7381315.1 hypothetical protein [archaeon]